MTNIFQNLQKLRDSDIYPFHMPGHKRNMLNNPLQFAYEIDITEIDNFDNLHYPEGIIKRAQTLAAKIYHVNSSYFLVNGSTSGILASIFAVNEPNDHILVARNCHKAVYHGVLLRNLKATYVYPHFYDEIYLNGCLSPIEIEKKFQENPNIKSVIITSPSFDGIVSNIAEIAKIVHKYGAILIVDEAHGAHFQFDDRLPKSATQCGADIVIESLHKTLPSFTQTAILHVCSNRIQEDKVQKFLGIFQTSSPSYLFMSTMEQCILNVNKNKKELFQTFYENLYDFYGRVGQTRCLKVITREILLENGVYDFDIGKIIITTLETDISGKDLYTILLEKYHLQMEMASENYVLAIVTINDTLQGLQRLSQALIEIDNNLKIEKSKYLDHNRKQIKFTTLPTEHCNVSQVMSLYEADLLQKESIALENAIGEISGEFVYLYPPGIPLIIPGEVITKEFVEKITALKEKGLPLQGLKDHSVTFIEIIKL